MNRLFCIALSVFLCSCAVTDKRHGGYHYTEGYAVSAAFDRFSAVSIQSDIEYGGYVYRDDNGYFYTYASGMRGSGELAFTPKAIDADVVGSWHTHGDSDLGLSGVDTDLAKRTCIPVYIMNRSREIFSTDPCGFLAKN